MFFVITLAVIMAVVFYAIFSKPAKGRHPSESGEGQTPGHENHTTYSTDHHPVTGSTASTHSDHRNFHGNHHHHEPVGGGHDSGAHHSHGGGDSFDSSSDCSCGGDSGACGD